MVERVRTTKVPVVVTLVYTPTEPKGRTRARYTFGAPLLVTTIDGLTSVPTVLTRCFTHGPVVLRK